MVDVEKRAEALGLAIPPAPAPKGSYVPVVRVGELLFTSGAGPVRFGTRLHCGYVGGEVSVDQAREAARVAVLNALGVLREALGTLDHVRQVIRLTGYVRSAPGFTGQTAVIDAASDLLVSLLGQCGKHARSAIGVAELPFGISVEIDLVVAAAGPPSPAGRPM